MNVKKYTEYMEKQAWPDIANWGNITDTGKQLLEKLPYLLAVPAGAGIAGGYVASKMTSPTNADTDKLQDDFLKEKLRTYVAKRQREMDIMKHNARSAGAEEKRTRDVMI